MTYEANDVGPEPFEPEPEPNAPSSSSAATTATAAGGKTETEPGHERGYARHQLTDETTAYLEASHAQQPPPCLTRHSRRNPADPQSGAAVR